MFFPVSDLQNTIKHIQGKYIKKTWNIRPDKKYGIIT